ncbi:hypothetical protein FJZ41_00275 [Candidatus Shapirobacteria bacterium]|nr:hypothetical protein [Candidatus Shapirobacteria bacterium]
MVLKTTKIEIEKIIFEPEKDLITVLKKPEQDGEREIFFIFPSLSEEKICNVSHRSEDKKGHRWDEGVIATFEFSINEASLSSIIDLISKVE